MKKIFVLLAFTFLLSNAYADQDVLDGQISCTGENYPTIEFSVWSGELTIIDHSGNVVVDADDGYNTTVNSTEPSQQNTVYRVRHHEEDVDTFFFTLAGNADLGFGRISTYTWVGEYPNDVQITIDEQILCEYKAQ